MLTYRWIGLTAFVLPAFIWMGVLGFPVTHETTLMATAVTVLQAVVGYGLGSHYDQIRGMAYLDSLTGVMVNRRFFEKLQQEVERARRNDYSVTLVFIDLDNFKKYNDMHGHVEGDKILCRFADLLVRSVREHDTVGRWGGEEFVVLLPHTETAPGAIVGERIQHNVRQELDGITVSIGLATFPNHANSATELAVKADSLMYEAKKQKNCMLIATK